ncbi:uncharacterized protein EHS24_001253 [Apiotrichum porosum]|uniref:Uncharacterized protein n=1 Tax=Apiotrichum porosum TaxID=105984 RepID=A0A427XKC8_9TREE|nr:uncharacterized protein EHS24_001253 [Apiotrichum porosum]RSH79214.1 hypothetical protein EHS24_001253 [Apiotrichum porosum]
MHDEYSLVGSVDGLALSLALILLHPILYLPPSNGGHPTWQVQTRAADVKIYHRPVALAQAPVNHDIRANLLLQNVNSQHMDFTVSQNTAPTLTTARFGARVTVTDHNPAPRSLNIAGRVAKWYGV